MAKKKLNKYIDFNFEIKSESIQECEVKGKDGKMIKVGKFTGFASTYGNEDQGGDVVIPGAFTKSLQESKNETIVLFNHSSMIPIGKGILEDSKEGLLMHAEINLDIEEGRSRMSLVRQGVLKALSIGFNTIKASFNDLGQRLLKELRLREVSLVPFPMNEEAEIFSVKGDGSIETIEETINEKMFDVFRDILAAKKLGSFKIDSKLCDLLIESLKSEDEDNHSNEPAEKDHSDEPEFKSEDIEETMRMLEELNNSISMVEV